MILIATPTRDTVTAGYVGDVVKLCRRHPDARLMLPLGIYIANLRQSCVDVALKTGATHVLFIDSDMRFPDDTLDRLLAHDLPIVAANYVQRTAPQWWTARKAVAWISSVGRTGLEEVDAAGFGVMLIKTFVFRAIGRPWFDTPYNSVLASQIGEDLYFCAKAKSAGFWTCVDHDLSQDVRHQGTIELGAGSQQAALAREIAGVGL